MKWSVPHPYRLAITLGLLGSCLFVGNYAGAWWLFIGTTVWTVGVELHDAKEPNDGT